MNKMQKTIKYGNRGFTIVELIVAAVIMAIAVVAIVAVVRTSTDMQIMDNNRRQARTRIMNVFETDFPYDNQPFGTYTFNGVDCAIDESATVPPTCIFGPITVDISDDLIGTMNVTVTETAVPEANEITAHIVEITVRWTEVNGVLGEVTLSKQLVELPL